MHSIMQWRTVFVRTHTTISIILIGDVIVSKNGILLVKVTDQTYSSIYLPQAAGPCFCCCLHCNFQGIFMSVRLLKNEDVAVLILLNKYALHMLLFTFQHIPSGVACFYQIFQLFSLYHSNLNQTSMNSFRTGGISFPVRATGVLPY